MARGWCGLLVLAGAGLAAGCASGPDERVAADDGRMALADSDAAFGYESTDWETPFWERWIARARSDAAEADEQTAASQRSARRGAATVAAASSDSSHAGNAVAATGMQPRIGVYIAPESRGSLAAYRLINALDRRAADHGIALVKPGELDDAVAGTDACPADTAQECPKLLSIFPGVRLLVVLDPGQSRAGSASVETRMLDTDFGVEYDTSSTTLEFDRADADEAGAPGSDVAVWSEHLLDLAADRLAIAPWFTHTFALTEDEDMYVSAGRESGLTVGDTLIVHGEGSVVRAPGGRPVAWNPGAEDGRVRVTQLVGRNVAVVEHVSGRRPDPRDRLTLAP